MHLRGIFVEYIPIIGILSGVIRCIANISDTKHACIKVLGVMRGICEILGAGILFLLIDLIVTLYIHCKVQHGNIQTYAKGQ